MPKLRYRFFRHPLAVLIFYPLYQFVIFQRFPRSIDGPKERQSVLFTNIFLLASFSTLIFFLGLMAFLSIFIPSLLVGTAVGNYLFYVQHQCEKPYWRQGDQWDYYTAAMTGSTFLKLPKIFQWFTAEIGFHHIHHLCHLIPHYNLERCYQENKLMQNPTTITFFGALKSLNLSLYDASTQELISFKEYQKRYA